MPRPLEEFRKALARLPLPLAEHDLESDGTIPYIIRHELAAHEPRLAELPEETPSFVVRRPRKANSSSEAELGQAEGWAPGKCQALTYGSPRARNYGYEKREDGHTRPPSKTHFLMLLPSCEERSTGQRPKTKDEVARRLKRYGTTVQYEERCYTDYPLQAASFKLA
ncbi:hypothetical protein NFJ02_44g111540 [Pycnococcus provasolii]